MTGKEIPNSGAYDRQTLNPLDANWAAPGVGGATSNSSAITFPVATADWGWVSGIAIVDNQGFGSGNMLFYGALTTPKLVGNGDQFVVGVGSLQITLA